MFRRTGDAIHGREGRPAASSLEYKATASCNSTVEVRVLKKQAAHPSRTPLPQYDVPVARMSVVYRACLALCVNANGQHAKQHRRHEGPGCTCVHHWVLGVFLGGVSWRCSLGVSHNPPPLRRRQSQKSCQRVARRAAMLWMARWARVSSGGPWMPPPVPEAAFSGGHVLAISADKRCLCDSRAVQCNRGVVRSD